MAEPIEQRLAAAGLPALQRPCWIEIDADALTHNLGLVRRLVGRDVQLNAVVKADAYGHGIEMAARAFARAGADRLCVASLDEAFHLRASGINAPILVLFQVPPEQGAAAAGAGIELAASEVQTTLRTLDLWRANRGNDAVLRFQLEVETGLARAGLAVDRVAHLCRRIVETPGVELAGIWSHLASAGDAKFSSGQVALFERAADSLRERGLHVPPRHLAASGGLLGGSAPVYEGVRPGLMLYGLAPTGLSLPPAARKVAASLRPAMAVKCRPLRVESVPTGTPVGYGGRWRSERPSRIATLPIGYGDGWSRSYAPGGQAVVRGRRVPLVGAVAMDALAADVTDVPEAGLGDEFALLGGHGDERINADELARIRNTISWEVVTSMAQRVPRVYHAGSVLLGVRTLGGEVRSRSGTRSAEGG